jgi:uncharacterized OsmC-like protein
MTSKVTYLGKLRTSSIHIHFCIKIISDVPLDNKGKAKLLPTDTVANALANCMMTVMGMKAPDLYINITSAAASVTVIMNSELRRFGGN